MRHLLILLISILLSSPVIGDNHKGKTLYPIFDDTGLFVDKNSVMWMQFGNETLPKYVGETRNGKPSGWGVLTFPKGRYFIGLWENGRQRKVKLYDILGNFSYDLDIDKNGKGTMYWGKKETKQVGKFLYYSPLEYYPFMLEEGITYKYGKPIRKVLNGSTIEEYINGEWRPIK